MKKILILEDDRQLAETLVKGLTSKRLTVTKTHTLQDFYQQASGERYELCLMDRMIGHEDAVEAIADIREMLPQAKILLLSKKSAVQDRIDGLETGADDYLAKPFSLAELRLRVKSLLSLYRLAGPDQEIVLGELTFYPLQGVLQTPVGKIILQRRETEIVFCLARAVGNVVSRAYLTRTLWPESYEPNPSTVDVYVRRLRQKLGKYRSILQTKRGFGYRLVPFQGE